MTTSEWVETGRFFHVRVHVTDGGRYVVARITSAIPAVGPEEWLAMLERLAEVVNRAVAETRAACDT